ncbi:MAG: hypothetical protein ACRYG8_05300 [Janthinobacterium lividum]
MPVAAPAPLDQDQIGLLAAAIVSLAPFDRAHNNRFLYRWSTLIPGSRMPSTAASSTIPGEEPKAQRNDQQGVWWKSVQPVTAERPLGADDKASVMAVWHHSAGIQPVQLVVPDVPPFPPLISGKMPDLFPLSVERALSEAMARAGRRLDEIGKEIGRRELWTAAGHALAARPFSAGVDNPSTVPMASSEPRHVDADGRFISPRASMMKPPGECTPDEHSRLQSEVTQACKTLPRACNSQTPVEELEARLARNLECGAAREKMMSQCFAGGDLAHRNETIRVWKDAAKCMTFMNSQSSSKIPSALSSEGSEAVPQQLRQSRGLRR